MQRERNTLVSVVQSALVTLAVLAYRPIHRRRASSIDSSSSIVHRPIDVAIASLGTLTTLSIMTCEDACRPVREPGGKAKRNAVPERPGFSGVLDRISIRREAYTMSGADARALHENWRGNRDDLALASMLLVYYEPVHYGVYVATASDWVERRREVALWVIEHHPDHRVTVQANAVFSRVARPRLADPEGTAAAERLWRPIIDAPEARPEALANAAEFFRFAQDEPRTAERALLRGRSLDPRFGRVGTLGPEGAWATKLAALYVDALTRPLDAPRSGESARPLAADEAFAIEIRDKLTASTDAVLLAEVGRLLEPRGNLGGRFVVDSAAFARDCLQRALALDPSLQRAREALDALRQRGGQERSGRGVN